jgi:hypothetical protein
MEKLQMYLMTYTCFGSCKPSSDHYRTKNWLLKKGTIPWVESVRIKRLKRVLLNPIKINQKLLFKPYNFQEYKSGYDVLRARKRTQGKKNTGYY